MNALDKFLKEDLQMLETQKYKDKRREVDRLNKIMRDVKKEEQKPRDSKAEFMRKLQEAGVKIIERNKKNDGL